MEHRFGFTAQLLGLPETGVELADRFLEARFIEVWFEGRQERRALDVPSPKPRSWRPTSREVQRLTVRHAPFGRDRCNVHTGSGSTNETKRQSSRQRCCCSTGRPWSRVSEPSAQPIGELDVMR